MPINQIIKAHLLEIILLLIFLFVQGKLFDKMKLHDTCGINNLHGMPGIISALASVILCGIATQDMYGERYHFFTNTIFKRSKFLNLDLHSVFRINLYIYFNTVSLRYSVSWSMIGQCHYKQDFRYLAW